MDYIQISAKTVEDAITEALIKLGTTSDKIEYEVLEKGSTGFLGFNSKPAVIKARKKYSMTDSVKEFLEGVFSCKRDGSHLTNCVNCTIIANTIIQ